MKNKVNKKQVSASGEPNDPSAATSRENAAPVPYKEPASGELAAAPCSAGGSTYPSEVFSKIAEFTGHEVKDFEGGWISECRSIIILPSNKIKTAYHMQAQEKWEVVAETDRLIVLKSCY